MTHPAPETESNGAVLTRRRFLAYLSGLLSALIAVLLAVPVISAFVGPALRRAKEVWVTVGSIDDVYPERPTRFTYRYETMDGWYRKVDRETVYAVKRKSGDFYVLSNICTHLGCGVRWDEDRRLFQCPCHDGRYDIEGRVTQGPPPKALPRFPHRLREGRIEIRLGA